MRRLLGKYRGPAFATARLMISFVICPDARGLINRVDRAYEERKGFRSENLAFRADIECSMPMPVALVRNVPNEAPERRYYCID